jgi:Arc/MetJ-type ribon-helix-helix transcriptional regulator
MTIHLPPELESSIQAAVHSGHFASLDAAMTEAASLLLERLTQTQTKAVPPAASHLNAAQADKPIWEEILELTADVPDEEFDKLPTDLAEQHDHYIYGTPKRPPSP